MGFDVRQFVEVVGLGAPVAVNFVWVRREGDGGGGTGTGDVRRTSLASAPCGIATAEAGWLGGGGWREELR